jgi:hypothetical protein
MLPHLVRLPGPPLSSSGQRRSSGSGLVTTTEKQLGRNSSGFGIESGEYGVGIRHGDHVAPSIYKRPH